MILYIYDTYCGNRSAERNTEQLISLAVQQYTKEIELALPDDQNGIRILRTQKGKPYIEGLPLHFSVSHSDYLWVCLIGCNEIGVDIQNLNHSNYEAIARRFFQPDEQKAVQTGGIEAFMAIWCRKEAFIKYYGMTIGEAIDWLDVAKDGIPATQIEYMGKMIAFTEIPVHPDFSCVAATSTKEEIWIRKIQVD